MHPSPAERQRDAERAEIQRMHDAAAQPARDKGALDVLAAMLRSRGDDSPAATLRMVEEVVRDSGRNLNPPDWDLLK